MPGQINAVCVTSFPLSTIGTVVLHLECIFPI